MIFSLQDRDYANDSFEMIVHTDANREMLIESKSSVYVIPVSENGTPDAVKCNPLAEDTPTIKAQYTSEYISRANDGLLLSDKLLIKQFCSKTDCEQLYKVCQTCGTSSTECYDPYIPKNVLFDTEKCNRLDKDTPTKKVDSRQNMSYVTNGSLLPEKLPISLPSSKSDCEQLFKICQTCCNRRPKCYKSYKVNLGKLLPHCRHCSTFSSIIEDMVSIISFAGTLWLCFMTLSTMVDIEEKPDDTEITELRKRRLEFLFTLASLFIAAYARLRVRDLDNPYTPKDFIKETSNFFYENFVITAVNVVIETKNGGLAGFRRSIWFPSIDKYPNMTKEQKAHHKKSLAILIITYFIINIILVEAAVMLLNVFLLPSAPVAK